MVEQQVQLHYCYYYSNDGCLFVVVAQVVPYIFEDEAPTFYLSLATVLPKIKKQSEKN